MTHFMRALHGGRFSGIASSYDGPGSDLHFEGLAEPLPWPGTPAEFRTFREQARREGGTRGMAAMELTWSFGERQVFVDLNRVCLLAAVERQAPAMTEEQP